MIASSEAPVAFLTHLPAIWAWRFAATVNPLVQKSRIVHRSERG
jgi:hypothetical protein